MRKDEHTIHIAKNRATIECAEDLRVDFKFDDIGPRGLSKEDYEKWEVSMMGLKEGFSIEGTSKPFKWSPK